MSLSDVKVANVEAVTADGRKVPIEAAKLRIPISEDQVLEFDLRHALEQGRVRVQVRTPPDSGYWFSLSIHPASANALELQIERHVDKGTCSIGDPDEA